MFASLCPTQLGKMTAVPATSAPLESEPEGHELKELQSPFQRHLARYAPIDDDLTRLSTFLLELKEASERFDREVETSERDTLVRQVEARIAEARGWSHRVKRILTGGGDTASIREENAAFEADSEVQGRVESEIRSNLYRYYLGRYFRLHKSYSRLANAFRTTVRDRAKRDIRLVCSASLGDDQIDDIIDRGLDQKLLEASLEGEIEDQAELRRLVQRSNAVMQINREVAQLLETFQDMAAMVDAQQETVDNVVMHVESAKAFTGQAAVDLVIAWEYKLAATRKMVCCLAVVLIVLVGVIGLIGASASGQI